MEELLSGCGSNPSTLACTHQLGERWFSPGVAMAMSAVTVCAVLCACLKPARDHHKCYNQLVRHDSEKQLETDCLKLDLRQKSKWTCSLEQNIELMLSQVQPPQ